MAALGDQLRRAARPRSASRLLVEEAEDDGEGVDGGAVGADGAVVGDVVLVERRAGAVRQGAEARRIVGRDRGGPPSPPRSRRGPVAGRRSRRRRVSALAFHGSCGDASGSSQSPNWNDVSHRPVRGQQRLDAAYVGRHRVVLPLQHRRSPYACVERPRHPDGRVAPDRGAVRVREVPGWRQVLEDVGDDERHHAVGCCCSSGQVDQPVGEEGLDVEQVRRGRRERGDVTGPAEPLVALRAVGRQVEEVALGAPHDVAVQLVEVRLGALEEAGARAGRSGRRPPRGRPAVSSPGPAR